MSAGSTPSPVPSPFALRTVIFATDFSQCSQNAGNYAALMARQFGAELLVAHTFVLSQAAMEVEAESHGAQTSAQRADFDAALRQEAERLGAGLQHADTALLEGEPEEQIPALAQKNAPSLIVLGTQGRGRFGRAMIGSTAEKILRSASGPALTVGPHVPHCCEGDPPIRRVLFATGLSAAAARGASCAVAMAEAFGAQMDVLHVIHPEDVQEPGSLTAVQKHFQAAVEEMAPRYAGAIVEPRGVVATGNAHTRILEHIRENAIDLLVLSLRASSHLWVESRISGAFNIVINAPCPVMTLVG